MPVSLQVQNDYLPAPDQGGPHDQARIRLLFSLSGDVRWWDLITGRIDHSSRQEHHFTAAEHELDRYIRYIDYPGAHPHQNRP